MRVILSLFLLGKYLGFRDKVVLFADPGYIPIPPSESYPSPFGRYGLLDYIIADRKMDSKNV